MPFENIVEKEENAVKKHLLLFPWILLLIQGKKNNI